MADSTVLSARSDVDAALSFFRDCMLAPNREKAPHYLECGMSGSATASEVDWIVLGALLTGDRPGGSSHLAQLSRHHVRSHPFGSGPRYTFVQEAVEEEFDSFKEQFHLVFSYADDLSRVELRQFSGALWVDYVEEFGGIEFFAFSRFTDPEIEIRPAWIYENAALLLVLDAGRVTFLNATVGQY